MLIYRCNKFINIPPVWKYDVHFKNCQIYFIYSSAFLKESLLKMYIYIIKNNNNNNFI